jgi:dihydroflavonol-4-reductase
MTCLVTGANGFVGAAVVRALVAAGAPVRAMLRPTSDCRNLEGLPVERVVGDVTDNESLRVAMQGCRFVCHVAADYRLWAPAPASMYRTNVAGSQAVLEAAMELGVEKMVYTSSVAVLGLNADAAPATETTPVSIDDMIGPYKRSKFMAEEALRKRAQAAGYPLVVVNPSTPIGPGDIKPTPTGRVILDAMLGRMPAYVDTGLNVVHVDDVGSGHVAALNAGRSGERYILGGTDLSLKEILTIVADLSGRPAPRVRLPRWSLYPVALGAELAARLTRRPPRVTRDELRMAAKHMYFSSEKARQELGYRSRPAEEAIADAVAWFRSDIARG